jgi:uncharacterized membrane-anchored protein
MQRKHIPSMGPRYWTILCVVSIFGANLGDFSSRNLHFGNLLGLVPTAVLIAMVFILERRDSSWNQAYYWVAVALIRAAATNLADFLNQDMNLRSFLSSVLLTVLLALALFWHRPLWSDSFDYRDRNKAPDVLPTTDARYWITMMIAGTLGTVIGDFFSFGRVQLGTGLSSIILSGILAVVFAIGSRGLLLGRGKLVLTVTYYWMTIVTIRAAGTAAGDHLAGDKVLSLGIGLALTTLVTGLVCAAVIFLWKDRASLRLRTSQA